MKKLVGRTDLEDALGRLDRLTQEEARMAAAQGLKATYGVDSKVQVIDNRVKGVDDKLHVVIDGTQIVFQPSATPSLVTVHLGVDKMREETKQVANDMGDQKRSLFVRPTQLTMTVQSLSQGINYDTISEIGSPPQIHLSITTSQAMLTMKALAYGLLKALFSPTGKNPGHCYGSTGNVRLPVLYLFALTNRSSFP